MGAITMVLIAISMLFQSGFSTLEYPKEGNLIIFFTDKQEVYLFDLKSKTSKAIFKVKEKGFKIDDDSIKRVDGKIFFTIEDKSKAWFDVVPGSKSDVNMTYEMYQTGKVYQKEYMIGMDGSIKLLHTLEIEALNSETLNIKETAFNSQTEPIIRQIKNREKIIYGPALFNKTSEKNGIKLIVEKRCLYIQRNNEEPKLLILADKEISDKVAYGCADPSINNNGTKGLCSYFAYPWEKHEEDQSGIIEIDLITNQITKHNEIIGFNPTFSLDDRYILYKKSNHYEVFNIQDKSIIKLPKSEYALWLY